MMINMLITWDRSIVRMEVTYHHRIVEIVNTQRKRTRVFFFSRSSLRKQKTTTTQNRPSAEQYDWQGRTCEVKQLDASRTIRPTKEHTKGTNRYTLHQKILTLKTGEVDFRTLARLPAEENYNEWLAVNVIDFYNEIVLLYGVISPDLCTKESCPIMNAGRKFTYVTSTSHHSTSHHITRQTFTDICGPTEKNTKHRRKCQPLNIFIVSWNGWIDKSVMNVSYRRMVFRIERILKSSSKSFSSDCFEFLHIFIIVTTVSITPWTWHRTWTMHSNDLYCLWWNSNWSTVNTWHHFKN